LVGVHEWTFSNTLDLATCSGVLAEVVPVAPTVSQPSCDSPNITVTMATVPDGVVYTASGPLTLAPGQSVTITPTADTGFTLVAGSHAWTITNAFDTATCAEVLPIVAPVRSPANEPLAATGTRGIGDGLVVAFVSVLLGATLTASTRRGRVH
jgi:hypothetical protein